MASNDYFEDISFFPGKKELLGYSFDSLSRDLMASITVALLTLPQAMAYALIAGLPLSCGLYAAIFSPLIAAMFGSSRHLIVGPTNGIAILIQIGTAEILSQNYGHLSGAAREYAAVGILAQLTLLIGIFHILAAGLKLGRLTRFVSFTVVIGYISGAALTILISQLFVFLGIVSPTGINSLFYKGFYLLGHLREIHWMTAVTGGLTLVLLLYFKRWSRQIPTALIAFGIVSLGVWGVHQVTDSSFFSLMLVGNTGNVASLHPSLTLPLFDAQIMNELLSIAFAIALLSTLETTALAKSIASSSGQRLSTNQEILGLGLGNIVSSFVGAMPISGSASRTSLNYENGARTRMAALFGACFVGVIIFTLGSLINHVPQAALAALILITATSIVKKHQLLLCLKSTSSDAWVFWITFVSCVFFSLDVAFYIGVGISITLYLKNAAVPHLQQYKLDDKGKFLPVDNLKKDEEVPILVIKVKGELFFGAADLFQTTLKAIAGSGKGTRVIILQLKNARDIDATACLALKQLHDFLVGSGRHLICSGLTLSLWEVLSGSGLVNQIGKENLFLIDEKNPHHYMRLAQERAWKLAAVSEEEGEENEGDEGVPEISQG